MKICILGAGSLGSAIGGTLAMGGSEVFLINHQKAYVEAVNRDGLRMTDEKTDWSVPVTAVPDAAGIGPVDLVIVLVKSYVTKKAVQELMRTDAISEDTLFMTLQNGLGNEEVIAEVVGEDRVLSGKTYVGGRMLEPGYVSATVKGKQTFIGEMSGEITPRAKAVQEEFHRAGMHCEISDNMKGLIWDKLLINVVAGALCAITRLPYGPLYEEDYIKETACAAVEEGIRVARAAGVCLTSEDPEYPWYAASKGLPGTFKTSMLQSLENGRPTEIDFINGAVVKWGEKYGIDTPVNRTLTACVKGIEKALLQGC